MIAAPTASASRISSSLPKTPPRLPSAPRRGRGRRDRSGRSSPGAPARRPISGLRGSTCSGSNRTHSVDGAVALVVDREVAGSRAPAWACRRGIAGGSRRVGRHRRHRRRAPGCRRRRRRGARHRRGPPARHVCARRTAATARCAGRSPAGRAGSPRRVSAFAGVSAAPIKAPSIAATNTTASHSILRSRNATGRGQADERGPRCRPA